jgi:hypothetical protein
MNKFFAGFVVFILLLIIWAVHINECEDYKRLSTRLHNLEYVKNKDGTYSRRTQ